MLLLPWNPIAQVSGRNRCVASSRRWSKLGQSCQPKLPRAGKMSVSYLRMHFNLEYVRKAGSKGGSRGVEVGRISAHPF
jgi:hypothetical protein